MGCCRRLRKSRRCSEGRQSVKGSSADSVPSKKKPAAAMAVAGFFSGLPITTVLRSPPFPAFLLRRRRAPYSLLQVLIRAVSNDVFHIGLGIRVADRPLFVSRDLVGRPVLTYGTRIGKCICSRIAHRTSSSSVGT